MSKPKKESSHYDHVKIHRSIVFEELNRLVWTNRPYGWWGRFKFWWNREEKIYKTYSEFFQDHICEANKSIFTELNNSLWGK